MDYRTWLNQTYGKGATSTAARAAAWRRLYGPITTPPAPQSDPERPRFTPGALDEDAIRQKANLDFDYQIGSQGIEQDYIDTLADINAQRSQVDKQRDFGFRDVDRNAGGRGIYRSGIRMQNRVEVGEQADEAHRQLSNAAIRAANARQRGLDTLTGSYRTNLTNLTADSNQRQRELWDERNPMTVSVPGQSAKRPAAKSYAEFLAGRKSTGALAREWDKKFNYGQRFG